MIAEITEDGTATVEAKFARVQRLAETHMALFPVPRQLPGLPYLGDAGTGGGLFRAMWADFLAETAELTGVSAFQEISDAYREVSKKWTGVAGLLHEAGVASSRESLHSASKLVHEAAEEEQHLMSRLMELSS
ncbi:DUF4872 domain-containing protein [Streptomyces sp. Li-HN-5-11]|uniref:DUF4872 domain-containing protein n=1 Tax=Streptomyces sp. Li-HN-5-11 TaxID=3075432 RepID=UPI0028AD3607|nr:DUF4872 domain-containing protein [Streptomyces sp. Li-HN-5-11]WNM35290.1 DUF4872 domain-containing protein [Streptomyces sp. Li-HN-5-11]